MNPSKNDATGRWIKIFDHRRLDRGFTLEPFGSRCVRTGEIHEIVVTDERQEGLSKGEGGQRVDRVAFIGFAEFTRAGVVERGDLAIAGEAELGVVMGFDSCHFPNHYNIIIEAPRLVTGAELGLELASSIIFRETSR
jgi:hypothetical protein